MHLYGLKSCDTCRAALKTLRGAGHDVAYIDVRTDGIQSADLERFIAEFGEAIINKRSTTWRGLSDVERTAPPLELLIANPTLMKRPVIEADGMLHLGWSRETNKHWALASRCK